MSALGTNYEIKSVHYCYKIKDITTNRIVYASLISGGNNVPSVPAPRSTILSP